MKDKYGRDIDYLRISLTDRCNLRCTYCMPEEGINLLKHEDILSYEEILKVCQAFIKLGIVNFKLTGGEPLVRKGIIDFIRELKALEGTEEVTITTNGVLLEKYGLDLIDAGIDRINISLDTMDKDKYSEITRGGDLSRVLRGIDLLLREGFEKIKINTVPTKPLKIEDLIKIIKFAKDYPIDVRFIKLMPIGLGDSSLGYSKEEMMDIIGEIYGKASPYYDKRGNGPASYYSYPSLQGKIGFIDAIDDKFCYDCNRIRLSARGFLKLCLHYNLGENIRDLINNNTVDDLAKVLEDIIYNKPLMHHMEDGEGLNVESHNMNQIGG